MLRKQTFWGGVHPAGRKELSSGAPLEDCPPPREVVIPLLQHIGKPCTPLVKAGDHVDMGQKIGDGEGLCVPVHASVSGTVKAVEPRSHPSGQPHLAVVIENDFQNTYHSAVPPCADTDALDADALIRRIREAGLGGMGGATFPTDIKANIGKVETLIANACECEPYITADDALLCTDADRAIRGLRLLRQLLKPRRTVIAIEDNKERAVSILTDKLKQQDEVELVVLPTRYPQGAEKQLIQAVTGRQVPSGGFPKDVGCAVFNIATCASVCRGGRGAHPPPDRHDHRPRDQGAEKPDRPHRDAFRPRHRGGGRPAGGCVEGHRRRPHDGPFPGGSLHAGNQGHQRHCGADQRR